MWQCILGYNYKEPGKSIKDMYVMWQCILGYSYKELGKSIKDTVTK